MRRPHVLNLYISFLPALIVSQSVRPSCVHDDSSASGGKDVPSEVGEPFCPSPSAPAIYESSTSTSAGFADQRVEGASPGPRSPEIPAIWELSSSDATTKASVQCIVAASPGSCSSGDPVIWESSTSGSTPPGPLSPDGPVTREASAAASEQLADSAPLSLSSNDDIHDTAERMSGVYALLPRDEDSRALTPDLVHPSRHYHSRSESSAEQELATPGGGALLLDSSSSDGAGSTAAAAMAVAAEERAFEPLSMNDAPYINDNAEGSLADANWLSGPLEDTAVESPSPSSDGASVKIWETSSSEAELEQQHDAAAGPANNGTATATLEEQPLGLKMPSVWPSDASEKNRDPLGDIP